MAYAMSEDGLEAQNIPNLYPTVLSGSCLCHGSEVTLYECVE